MEEIKSITLMFNRTNTSGKPEVLVIELLPENLPSGRFYKGITYRNGKYDGEVGFINPDKIDSLVDSIKKVSKREKYELIKEITT